MSAEPLPAGIAIANPDGTPTPAFLRFWESLQVTAQTTEKTVITVQTRASVVGVNYPRPTAKRVDVNYTKRKAVRV